MRPVLSTAPDAPELRLLTVPFHALDGLSASLGDALAQVLGGSPAERALDRFLRAHRSLSADQRQATSEAIFGVALWRRRLAWHAGLVSPPGDPREAEPEPEHARTLLFVLLRDLARIAPVDAAAWSALSGPPPPARAPPESFAQRFSFPDWLAGILLRELGPQSADAFGRAINVPGPVTLRANSLVGTREDLAKRLVEEGVDTVPGRWSPLALHVTSPRPNLFGLRAWREGAFEVQDEGSQLIAPLLELRPGETVLDFCAGAGGKALQLAAEIGGAGAVHAWDIDAERLTRLRARARRAHAATHIHIHHPEQPPPVSLQADAVLVDAPCSELGTLRRSPDLRFRIDPRSLSTLPPLQRDILERAHRHLRPGGRLVYTTCTLRPEENEDVALSFERAHPEFRRRDPPLSRLEPSFIRDGFFQAWPHVHGTDGFFGVVWIRRS
jgi:16S rRNA (cytosine967-C5)-methyltransferase